MHPWDKDHWLPGVLSTEQIQKLIDNVYIDGVNNFEDAADYSSFDLFLSDKGYRMIQGSIKPCGDPSEPYINFLKNESFAEPLLPDEDGCFCLKANECYVFQLKEELKTGKLATSNIFGMGTAKSSIGRVDVIARLLVDGMRQYEYFDSSRLNNSTGNMFLEIIPISFNIRVKPNTSLSQLRLFYGDPDESIIIDKNFIKGIILESKEGDGFLSVEISNTQISELDVVAFRASVPKKENETYIDLWKKNTVEEKPDPCDYWCFDKADDSGRFELKNGSFYLLRSKERIKLPSRIAVYARPMDETLGEMRIHYAGFAHPFFGDERNDDKVGTPLIFEVRAHNVNVNLDDGERLARMVFYRMSEQAIKKEKKDHDKPDNYKYDNQELDLSKYFGEWPDKLRYHPDQSGKVEKIK